MLKASKNSPYITELEEGCTRLNSEARSGRMKPSFRKFGNLITNNQVNILLVLNFILKLHLSVEGTAYAIVYQGKFF